MRVGPYLQFAALAALPGLRHRFTLRQSGVDVEGEREEVIERLRPGHEAHVEELGFSVDAWRVVEQVHGAAVASVGEVSELGAGMDGLVTNRSGVMLGIYVADCCAVFLVDAEVGSLGLVHSGRKGSELGITGVAIRRMVAEHGARPERMQVVLSPCIRPPLYEVDFAAMIRASAQGAGVPEEQIHDHGECTGSDGRRFYSYRMEKGRTGRMLALLGRLEE